MTDLFSDDIELDPEPDGLEPEPEERLLLEPEPDVEVLPAEDQTYEAMLARGEVGEINTAVAKTGFLANRPLVEVLPAGIEFLLLTKFCPNEALKAQADEATRYALSVEVAGAEGLTRADAALEVLRARQKAIQEHFEEPALVANALHRHITSTRAEWLAEGQAALKLVGTRMYTEDQRLKAVEAEARRQAQVEADRVERARLQREAEAAAAAKAPESIVEELKRQAATATAAPVSSVPARAPLHGSTSVKTWKARLVGTFADLEPNPEMEALSDKQRLAVFSAMRAVLEGKAPLLIFSVNWAYLNKRAVADKATMAISGFESFETGGMRGKGRR